MSDNLTPRDVEALSAEATSEEHLAALLDRQPREREISCPMHDARHPVTTWNLAGYCDEHYFPPAVRTSERGTVTITLAA